MLASCCVEQAETIRTVKSATGGPGFAATSAAIAAVYVDVAVTAEDVARRLESIGYGVAMTSALFGRAETTATQSVTAVSSQLPPAGIEV